MTMQSAPMATGNGKPSVWTRRNVLTLLAGAVGLPLLAGVGAVLTDSDRSFWAVVGTILLVEAAAASFAFAIGSMIPRVRNRLELPAYEGDERERLIAMKATQFTFLLVSTALMVAWMTLLVSDVLNRPLTINADGMLAAVIAFQFTQAAATVYYSRRM